MSTDVLHLIDNFEQGGTERQALQLVRMLAESGRFNVRLACFERRGVLLKEAEALGLGEIEEYPLRSFYDANAARQLRRFARHLKRERIRVVHAHGFYTNVFGVTGASLARVSARIASRRESRVFRTPARERFERRMVFPLAHAVIANAETVRAELLDGGVPARKVFTIYNGLDLARVAPSLAREAALEALGLPRGRRFVTLVANMGHPVKDQPTFLRAARLVRDAVPDAAFVLAGEGRLLEEYRALASSLGLAEDVHFTGRCERVGDLLAGSDVCVLSSKAEGFSNAILEYMAAARPVVATDVGGAREAIEEGLTGFVVAPGDAETMAARIVELLRDTVRARSMGERGRRVVEERFSCEAQLARTEALYESLLERRALPQTASALPRRESA